LKAWLVYRYEISDLFLETLFEGGELPQQP